MIYYCDGVFSKILRIKMVYFDSAGSYNMLDEVIDTLKDTSYSFYANPSSSHALGELQAKEIEHSRTVIANSIGCYPSEIVFTSGATESNNLALKQILNQKEKAHIITSAVEHKCVLSILFFIRQQGHEVTVIQPNSNGTIALEALKKEIKPNTQLVSLMHVNNELGVINPISEIGQFCFEQGILFHTDAAQSFGKVQIDVDDMNIDMMSISAHKIGGPKGIGALYIRDLRTKNLLPIIHGAGQESGLRGGTLATPLILGFSKAISVFPSLYENKDFSKLYETFHKKIKDSELKFRINGRDGLKSILSITFENVDIPLFLRETSNDFAIAQGSACSSKEIEASHVLSAIGLSRREAENTLRLSFDHTTEVSSIEVLLNTLLLYKLKS